jgi:hypothetical protein
MAITILSQPDFLQPIYSQDGNNTAFVLDSTDSSLCSMKYVSEISINGNLATILRNSPNLDSGKCASVPYKVIADFLSYDLWRGPDFQICNNSIVDYTIRFGEESDGTFDCSSGDYQITWGPSFSGKAFNGTLQYLEKTFDETQWTLVQPLSAARFLTNAPLTQNIQTFEHSALYYIQGFTNSIGNPNAPSATTAMEIIITNNDNTTETWYVLNFNAAPAYTMWAIGVGPNDINTYVTNGIVFSALGLTPSGDIIDCDVKDYSVRITDYTIVG